MSARAAPLAAALAAAVASASAAAQTPPRAAPPPAAAPARPPASPAAPPAPPVAELQTLDKITGRVGALAVGVGEAARVGTLTITVRACRKRPPEEPPETAAFLEIDEQRGDAAPKRVFSGWMFASSPAISALEHPVYDVRMIDCRAAAPASSSSRPN